MAIINDLAVIAFWTVFFLSSLIVGAGIGFGAIFQDAMMALSVPSFSSLFCAFLLFFFILFPIFILLLSIGGKLEPSESIRIFFPTVFWAPWRGLVFQHIKSNGFFFWLRDLVKLVCWWALFAGSVLYWVTKQHLSLRDIFSADVILPLLPKMCICFSVLLVIFLVSNLAFNSMTQKWRNQ